MMQFRKQLGVALAGALAGALVLAFVPAAAHAQGDPSVGVKGGIKVSGWMGKVDAQEAAAGMTVDSARFVSEGANMHATTGPAITYWNPGMKGTGDYVVKAKFTEAEYMGLNSHAHPYGIVIAGNDMGTDAATYLYCAAYGNGTFIVRGFGPQAFQMNGPRGVPNAAVNKAEAKGKSVTQEIAMQVKGNNVSCIINGKEVASYSKSEVVGAGKLKSTDGMVGFRMGHNTDALVEGFTIGKP